MQKPPVRTFLSRTTDRVQEWVCERFHHITGPYQDERGSYRRCIDCGRRIAWHDAVPIRDPRGRKAA